MRQGDLFTASSLAAAAANETSKIVADERQVRVFHQTPFDCRTVLRELPTTRCDRSLCKCVYGVNSYQKIRGELRQSVAWIAKQSGDRDQLVASAEWIGQQVEQEIDRVRREESRNR